jgi:hypothetical protein
MAFRCYRCGDAYTQHVTFCTGCWASGTVVLVGERSRAAIDAAPEVVTAGELSRASWQDVSVAAYPSLRIGRGSIVLVYGPPSSGKSTFVTRALDTVVGTVVLVSSEEAPGPSLAARLQRSGVKRTDFVIVGRATVDQVVALCRQRRAVALGIDSVQLAAYTAEELRHLLVVMPTVHALFAVSQVNKSGRPEGREAMLHESDVAIEVADMAWRLVKSRFQATTLTGAVVAEALEVRDDDVADGVCVPVLHGADEPRSQVRRQGPTLRLVPKLRDEGVSSGRDGYERLRDRLAARAGDEREDAHGPRLLRLDEREGGATQTAASPENDGTP